MNKKLEFVLQVIFFCHKRPDRSFHFKGKQFPLCARCTGLLVGYMLSGVLLYFTGLFNGWIILFLILPLIIDGTGQLFGRWTSTNTRRFLTGFPAGISISFIVFTMLHYAYQLGHSFGQQMFN